MYVLISAIPGRRRGEWWSASQSLDTAMEHAALLAGTQSQSAWEPHGHIHGRATYWLAGACGPRGYTEFAILAGTLPGISQQVHLIRQQETHYYDELGTEHPRRHVPP